MMCRWPMEWNSTESREGFTFRKALWGSSTGHILLRIANLKREMLHSWVSLCWNLASINCDSPFIYFLWKIKVFFVMPDSKKKNLTETNKKLAFICFYCVWQICPNPFFIKICQSRELRFLGMEGQVTSNYLKAFFPHKFLSG